MILRSSLLAVCLLAPFCAALAQSDDPKPLQQERSRLLEASAQKRIRRAKAELNRIARARKKFRKSQSQDKAVSDGRISSPVLQYRRKVMPLTLEQAINMGLQNDLGLQIAYEQALARGTGVQRALGDFDPQLRANVSRRRSRRSSIFQDPLTGLPTNSVTNQFDSWTFGASVSQLFSTGGTGTLSWNQTRSETKGATNNPQIDVSFTATFNQPLLRGRGFEVTLARLRNSRLDRADAFANLVRNFQGVVLELRQAYWRVVTAEENLRVQRLNFRSALNFLNQAKIRLSEGTNKKFDITVAEVALARRQESVISAETELENARDNLLNRIAPSSELLAWDTFIVPLDRPSYIEPPNLDLPKAVARAFENRLDLQVSARDIERQQRNLVVAENNLQPNLDLSLTAGILGTAQRHRPTYRLLDPVDRAFVLQGGLELRFPLFFRAERAAKAQARHNLRAAELSVEQQRVTIIREIREATRNILNARERVLINQSSVRLNEEQVAGELELVKEGQSTAFRALDTQQDLANARLALQRALIDYRESIAAYQASLGVLIDRYSDSLPDEAQQALSNARGKQ